MLSAKKKALKPLVDNIGNEEGILCSVHKRPSFPEGQDSLMRFIYKNYKFPNKHINDSGVLVTVVSVSIDENGNPFDSKIVRAVNKDLDKEALRLVRLIKKWEPGKNSMGKAVKSSLYIPIRVHLE